MQGDEFANIRDLPYVDRLGKLDIRVRMLEQWVWNSLVAVLCGHGNG